MVSFNRSGRKVKLETFSSKDVAEYLDDEINKDCNNRRFEISANTKWFGGILATIDGASFIIYANSGTWIEISCNIKDAKNMADVINALKRWNRFSQTEGKRVVEFNLEDKVTHIIVFENGYASGQAYKSHFNNYELSITEF